MECTIVEYHDTIPCDVIERAVQFYAKYLKISKRVDLLLDFEDGFDIHGEIAYENKNRFVITIKNGMNKRRTLIALAHEMVHLKQYSKGQLKVDKQKKNRMIYCGKSYNDNKNYWDTPWEIEAFGRELGLYCQFMESEKRNVGAGVGHGRDL